MAERCEVDEVVVQRMDSNRLRVGHVVLVRGRKMSAYVLLRASARVDPAKKATGPGLEMGEAEAEQTVAGPASAVVVGMEHESYGWCWDLV